MRRGEIWWAELPRPLGAEPGYRRPVLIVSADEFNRSRIRTVLAAAITGNLALAAAPGNVRLRRSLSGLPRPCVVNVSQIATADRAFLTGRAGRLPGAVMRRVDEGLRLALALGRLT